jgi:hypothetical protein
MVKANKRRSDRISTAPFSLIWPIHRMDHHAAGKIEASRLKKACNSEAGKVFSKHTGKMGFRQVFGLK